MDPRPRLGLDSSMTPTQAQLPDFDDLSAIDTSFISKKSKISSNIVGGYGFGI